MSDAKDSQPSRRENAPTRVVLHPQNVAANPMRQHLFLCDLCSYQELPQPRVAHDMDDLMPREPWL
jgi:hypothetical protein